MAVTTVLIGVIVVGSALAGRLDAGPIYLRNIFRIMPYNNFAVIIKLSGAEVKKLIDYSISKKKTPFFIQTHGITYEEVNGAASNIKIKGEALDENKIYSAAADNYMASGGAEDNIIKNLSDDPNNASAFILLEFNLTLRNQSGYESEAKLVVKIKQPVQQSDPTFGW